MDNRMKQRGFTLIEMLLVMVIIGMIIYASIGYLQRRAELIRIDRTSVQTQQILNAGLAYYVVNGKWPTQMNDLFGTYLPQPQGSTFNNSWQQAYQIASTRDLLYVYSAITSKSAGVATLEAGQIAGMLPLSYTSADGAGSPPNQSNACGTGSVKCYVVSAVNVPGRNLNNANAVGFAGLYHHGGCVPVPTCPYDSSGTTMSPQVFVVPVSVSGTNETNSTNSPNVYPISSFTAYAVKPPSRSPALCSGSTAVTPSQDCSQNAVNDQPDTQYWRVCLQVVTQKGSTAGVGTGDSSWGRFVTLLAFTRCAVNTEVSGSNFNVYSN